MWNVASPAEYIQGDRRDEDKSTEEYEYPCKNQVQSFYVILFLPLLAELIVGREEADSWEQEDREGYHQGAEKIKYEIDLAACQCQRNADKM